MRDMALIADHGMGGRRKGRTIDKGRAGLERYWIEGGRAWMGTAVPLASPLRPLLPACSILSPCSPRTHAATLRPMDPPDG